MRIQEKSELTAERLISKLYYARLKAEQDGDEKKLRNLPTDVHVYVPNRNKFICELIE